MPTAGGRSRTGRECAAPGSGMAARASSRVTFRIADDEVGQRIDKLVVKRAGIGRKRASELFAAGSVRVDGRRVAKGATGARDAEVVVELEDEQLEEERDAPLAVRFESSSVLVVSKPAGQPTVPLRAGERGTLAGALLGGYPELRGIGHGPLEPGLIHRLDVQTSGLVVAARTAAAFESLSSALAAGRLRKRYLAVVERHGLLPGGAVDRALLPDSRDGKRVRVCEPDDPDFERAHQARTRYRTIATHGRWALVELEVSRAYRHQIRVHLGYLGHPIAGDALYGGPAADALGQRHALHASYIAWEGDDTVGGFAVEEPLPAAMAALVGR